MEWGLNLGLLPPLRLYGFLRQTAQTLPDWPLPMPEPMAELATLVLRHGVADVLEPAERRFLEQEALPAYLARRRWFASKDEKIQSVSISAALPDTTRENEFLLSELEVTLPRGVETCLLPLAIAGENAFIDALPRQ